MLALAYAARHPDRSGPIVLVGCGTFNRASRDKMLWNLIERTDATLKKRLKVLDDESLPPEEWVKKRFELLAPLYIYEPNGEASRQAMENLDVRAHRETWEDMVRLQEAAVYPAAFSAIESPVLMIHGEYDPHPGRMIRDSLKPYLPQLGYVELERCGHQPWLEKQAAEIFFKILNDWLELHLK
jgi:pimeloyl-ACP methyl ester carboxylesterase